MKFKIDVSRTFKNKTGYQAGGYKLNSSFVTEEHTPESLAQTVIREGWPYTMHHAKVDPKVTGAAERGVKTSKHIENFSSMQVLTFDDDSKQDGVVNGWLNDSFFSEYGWAFVESVNSKPGEEKGHPTIILDSPITDPELLKECYQAFCTRHKRLDWLINIDRTIYNAENATIHLLGNICPFVVFEQVILKPYRQQMAELERQAIEKKVRMQVEWENTPADEIDSSDDAIGSYIQRSLDGIVKKVAGSTTGRNGLINWSGYTVAGIQNAGWASSHMHLFNGIEGRIAKACDANGYNAEHGHGQHNEAIRVFNLGFSANRSDYADPPKLRKANPKPKKAELVEVTQDENQIEEAYQEGYKDGWFEGFKAGLSIGRPYWNQIGMNDEMITYYELGFCPEKEALTTPYWSLDRTELLDVEFNNGEFNYENQSDTRAFFLTDPSTGSGKYTFITPDSLSAAKAFIPAAEYASANGTDTPLIIGCQQIMTPRSADFLDQLDTENLIFICKHGQTFDPSLFNSLKQKCKFVRINTDLNHMFSRGFDWIEWTVNRAEYFGDKVQ